MTSGGKVIEVGRLGEIASAFEADLIFPIPWGGACPPSAAWEERMKLGNTNASNTRKGKTCRLIDNGFASSLGNSI